MIRDALRGSLRGRLLLGTLIWIAVSLLFAGWSIGRLFQEHVEAQFHAELNIHLDRLTAQLALDEQGRTIVRLPPSDPRLDKPHSGLYWQIDRLAENDVPAVPAVLRSRSLWDQILTVPADELVTGEVHQHRIDGPHGKVLGVVERSVRMDDRPLRLIVAADESLMVEPVARFKGQLWLALGVLGAGLAFAAQMQVLIGLSPLRRLQDALSRVREGKTRRLEGGFPTEIMPLVAELNNVLEQNDEVVERARTQAGNLAHALKTPLSVLANAASLPERKSDELARLVVTQVEGARKQVDYHLARAKAATAIQRGARTPLEPVVDGLLRTMRRIHAAKNLTVTVLPMEEAITFRGEEHDLQEMLGNLIDNACKWAASRIEIQVQHDKDQLVLIVDDDGKGIAAEQRAAMLHRGVRADEQVPGTGLGLAIVDDLARLYGGKLALSESPLGGLRATLNLPVAAREE